MAPSDFEDKQSVNKNNFMIKLGEIFRRVDISVRRVRNHQGLPFKASIIKLTLTFTELS